MAPAVQGYLQEIYTFFSVFVVGASASESGGACLLFLSLPGVWRDLRERDMGCIIRKMIFIKREVKTVMNIINALAQELHANEKYVENVVQLLDEGNTIPFIARYRKELHGAMDDTTLRTLEERLQYLRNLDERRESVKKSIAEQGKLTDELAAAIDSAKTLAEVEDLYRPYKQKRRTRATAAREKGLDPLAALLFAQERSFPGKGRGHRGRCPSGRFGHHCRADFR